MGMSDEHGPSFQKKVLRWAWIAWRFVVYILESIADGLIEAWHIISHDAGLFWGVGFSVIGLFGFSSGRYCDGNTAEYLSCTRPATYYYYDIPHMALLLLGIFFVMVWLLRSRHKHSHI